IAPSCVQNIFPAVLSVILVFWIGFKLRNRKEDTAE
ncbi:hypothetical protein LTSEADE_5676, partial [Salmonella enterica subsp. enterica serovar Adelaide str. A4-669]